MRIEKKFNTETLANIKFGEDEKYEVLVDETIDTTRWSIISRFIFKDKATDEIWETEYSEGATEIQDEGAFEYHNGTCFLVEPYEKVITDYRTIEKE